MPPAYHMDAPPQYQNEAVKATGLGDVMDAYNIYSNIKHGGTSGDIGAVIGAGKVAAGYGAFGANSSGVAQGLGEASALYGTITGIQKGGVVGYTSAGVNAARLAAQTGVFGDAASSALGDVAGYVAAPLALYNFANNWRSGATGSDAASGAAAGAAIGSVVPGIGTVIGAVIGGVVGAASSIFGPGREDPENVGWNQYADAYSKGGQAAVAGASPSENYQMLAGIFDSRGSNIPFYNAFGRMGEGAFLSSMASQINTAVKQGKIKPDDSPQTVYARVIGPWVNSMAGPGGWQNTFTVKGAPEKDAVQHLLQNLIGQYTTGQITAGTPLGISGQTDPTLPAFAGLGIGASHPIQPGSIAGNNPAGMAGMTQPTLTPQQVAGNQQLLSAVRLAEQQQGLG